LVELLDDINIDDIIDGGDNIDGVEGIDGVDSSEELEGDFEGQLKDSTICSSIESASFSSLEVFSSSEVKLPVLLLFGTL